MTREHGRRQRGARRGAGVLAVLALSSMPCVPGAEVATELYPLEDVRPGMRAVGRTVFQGEQIEEFELELLGVMKNALSPKRDVVFARLVGAKVESTGVASGMSGSPVYVDGKLLGALAFRFGQFTKEPLCGITPIAYMVALEGGPQGAGNPGGVPGGVPLSDRVAIAGWGAELRRFLATRHETPFDAAARLRPSPVPAGVAPIGAALSFGGFSREAMAQIAPALASLGVSPVAGGTLASIPSVAAVDEAGAAPPLSPGSSVAVQLVRGDMDVNATGTVTHVDGDRLYAFGHQFFNFGRVSLPMARASVLRVLVSDAGSYKIATVGEPIGRFSQDRVAGIFGHVGREADMVPVKIAYADGAGSPISYEYEIAADPVIAPLLLQFSLQNVFHAADKDFGEKTLRVQGTIGVDGQREVAVGNFFTGGTAYTFASSYVAALMTFLYGNEIELPRVTQVSLQIEASDDVRLAEVEGVVPSTYAVSPGDTVKLKVTLKPRRGEPTTVTQELSIPADAPAGPATIYVGDARSLGRLETQGGPFAPRSMGDVIDILNAIRRDNHLYASLASEEPGLVVNGHNLPGVPASVQGVLQGDQGISRATVPAFALAEASQPTDFTLSGYRQLRLQIAPRPEP